MFSGFFSLLDFLSEERKVFLRWVARLGDVSDDGAATAAGVVGMDWRGAERGV